MKKVKTASEQLKEKLIDLRTTKTVNKKFNVSEFESLAKKVKNTFTEVHENPQYRKSI